MWSKWALSELAALRLRLMAFPPSSAPEQSHSSPRGTLRSRSQPEGQSLSQRVRQASSHPYPKAHPDTEHLHAPALPGERHSVTFSLEMAARRRSGRAGGDRHRGRTGRRGRKGKTRQRSLVHGSSQTRRSYFLGKPSSPRLQKPTAKQSKNFFLRPPSIPYPARIEEACPDWVMPS
ncbi:hypothetical protein SKAU_G00081560 [Synaphobranchus kaupii]|uniref:Uncharacterized protein n=1 Tax=Synaphobranchus kaupii TaxID=118154 RepID=A0A9Q1FVR2_SYNKA|nr:hypothetical protein SKAU_G00081560 [Synaphobranchus kaupii]